MKSQNINLLDLRIRVGWIILVVLSTATAINSFTRIFLEPFPEFVVGWVAASLSFSIILLIPFRKGERWAWYSTWTFAALLASVFVIGAHVGLYYLTAAAIAVICLLLTRPYFFQD